MVVVSVWSYNNININNNNSKYLYSILMLSYTTVTVTFPLFIEYLAWTSHYHNTCKFWGVSESRPAYWPPVHISKLYVRSACTVNYVILLNTGWPKKLAPFLCILTDVQIPWHLKRVATQPCEMSSNWGKLSQRFIDHAISQWRRRLDCVAWQGVRTHWTFDVKTAWCDSYFRQ